MRPFTLNGDVEFAATFMADVLNPPPGTIVEARVVNTNRLGVMAVVSDEESEQPLMEIIVVKGGIRGTEDDPRLDNVNIGQVIRVEVVGKRFQLNDTKISVVGRLARDEAPTLARLNAEIDDEVFMPDICAEDADEVADVEIDGETDSEKSVEDENDESELLDDDDVVVGDDDAGEVDSD